ncbi:hypothetical protein [Candidatus Methylomirabilis sp.]|uniref:hypothetical protein n=1 Tax=Candidatus Methylomirabilis sp. TaxID=2032687 RepID=UPI002A604D90|nr:hypothetical protein [Candidatus Methylomirabilis sp.]
MKVWVYVEGESDRIALNALWAKWRTALRQAGWGVQLIPLDDKSRFFRKIGPHATEKLLADPLDLVVGLPDFYPNQPFVGTPNQHATVNDLVNLQRKLVQDTITQKGLDAANLIQRFHPSSLTHDLEMLLLAARDQLRAHLGTSDHLGHWRHPVEDQNQDQPPKRVVQTLYLRKKGRAYRDTKDAAAVLGTVTDLQQILHSESGQLQCPVFKNMLDWIGTKTGVPAC